MDTAGINFDLSPFVRKQMSQFPRRSPRLQGDRPEAHGSHSHEPDHAPNDVLMVDLTDGEDLTCSVCGFADGVLGQFSCCQSPVHPECQGNSCPWCDDGGSELLAIEECVLCRTEMAAADLFQLPCCQQRLHLECLVRSFQSCGVRCPFCQVDLVSMASSEQFQAILGGHIEFDQPLPDPIHQPQVPPPPLVFPLCCHRIGGPQISFHWRIVAWSGLPFTLPVPGVLHRGHTSGVLSCSRTFRVEDVPPLPEASCPECQRNSGVVLDVTTGDVRRVCTFCSRVVSVPDPPVPSSDWFSSGPLCQLSPLYGWDSPTLSQPGEGTQSWLFCPLISLGLLAVETRLSVPPFSTGPRAPVPEEQIQFWTHQAPDIIVAFAVHFSTISHNDPLAVALSSPSSWGPSGDHLVASLQEALTPPHILSQMEVWLSSQVATFRGEGALPVPHSPPADPATEVHSPPVPSPFAPHPHTVQLSPTASPRSPFASVQTHAPLHGAVVSNPFAVSGPATPPNRPSPLPGAGPVRLTRFLEMPRDEYYATVNSLIVAGRFNHIGEPSVRLEGQTAWGVWLRIDHWRAGRGSSRLRLWSVIPPSQPRTHIPWCCICRDSAFIAIV